MPSRNFEGWISEVASNSSTMSQRNLRWVEANGGVSQLVQVAKKRGIHLARLTDDKGKELFVASQHAFQTLC